MQRIVFYVVYDLRIRIWVFEGCELMYNLQLCLLNDGVGPSAMENRVQEKFLAHRESAN